jgi:hypothetical protein
MTHQTTHMTPRAVPTVAADAGIQTPHPIVQTNHPNIVVATTIPMARSHRRVKTKSNYYQIGLMRMGGLWTDMAIRFQDRDLTAAAAVVAEVINKLRW